MPASTRLTRGLVALVLGAASMTTLVRPAVAQQAPSAETKKRAKQYVDAALAAQEGGDFDQAVTLYQKAYDLIPHPLMLFNIGQAQRLAGRDEEALAAYQKYIAADPNGPKAKEAQGFIAEIQPRVAKARADKEERDRQAAEDEQKRKDAEAKAAEAEKKRKEAEDAAKQREEEDAAEAKAQHDRGTGGSGRKKLGLIVGGSGVAVAGAGAVFGVLAMKSWRDAKAVCGNTQMCANDADTMKANQLADDTRLRGNLSTILLGVGGAAIAAGIVLYVTAPSESSTQQAVRITPSRDGGLVTWSGQW
jgi:tetratricopeptide (TPR) repeat protein